MAFGLAGAFAMLIGVELGASYPWGRVVAYTVGCVLCWAMVWGSWNLRRSPTESVHAKRRSCVSERHAQDPSDVTLNEKWSAEQARSLDRRME